MSLKVLVVPDKFKGTLTASAAAESIAAGWLSVRSSDQLDLLPMSDGGDGFGDVLNRLMQATVQTTPTVDAAHQQLNSPWGWNAQTCTAIIESAQVIGLALLPSGKFHPFDLDTFGLGAVIRAAAEIGAENYLIGVGGSATNDGGFGLARALGWKFLDQHGRPIPSWNQLSTLANIIPPADSPKSNYEVAVDVQNPLLGPSGASRIYGPQKGLRAEDMAHAEKCLERLARVAAEDLGVDVSCEPGTGAAGGLGFGLRCFLGARLESGFKLFAQEAHLEKRIRQVQLVITAEGAIDASTLMGKGVGEVAALCQNHRVPCIGLAGTLALTETQAESPQRFSALHGIAPTLTSAEDAKSNAAFWLRTLAAQAAQRWNPNSRSAG